MTKKIFISYSDFDKNKMRHLERVIKAEQGLDTIIIADNKRALIQLTDKVKNGIKDCNYFIPIITRQSIKTQWINQEIGFAVAKGNCKIIPIVEKQIIDDLKGFIHRQVDLPYCFEGNIENRRSESIKFVSVARNLVKDIIDEIKNISSIPKFTPSDIKMIKRGNPFGLG